MVPDAHSPQTSAPGTPTSPNKSRAPKASRKVRGRISAEAMTSRAVELLRSEDEQVCYDSLAGEYIGSIWVRFGRNRFVKRFLIKQTDADISGMPGWVVARTRYIDDFLKAQMGEGFKQLVILGAGYDTRTYRFYKLLEGAKIFEVDHPDAQMLRTWRNVGKRFGSYPQNSTYVDVDLESEKLEKKLPENGYDKNLKTLFIWEGGMMYLSPKSVDQTLAFIANNSRKGSIVIFEYLFASVLDKTLPSKEAQKLRNHCASAGEPLLFGLKEGSLEEFLASRGFDLVENMTAQSLKDAYFKGKGQQRKVFPLAGIVVAKVKQR